MSELAYTSNTIVYIKVASGFTMFDSLNAILLLHFSLSYSVSSSHSVNVYSLTSSYMKYRTVQNSVVNLFISIKVQSVFDWSLVCLELGSNCLVVS
jgi:hypothetical protein